MWQYEEKGLTMNFIGTEFIHYNDRLFKNPHPLCSALSVFRDGMKEEKKEAYFFSLKLIPS